MIQKSLKTFRYCIDQIGFCYLFFHSIHLLILYGDVELNQGSKKLSLCYWNLNLLAGHDFGQADVHETFTATDKLDFTYLSQSHLDCTISSDNNNIFLDGYKLICVDHPRNIKHDVVCYYRVRFPAKTIQINYLREDLVCEVNYENKFFYCYIVSAFYSN